MQVSVLGKLKIFLITLSPNKKLKTLMACLSKNKMFKKLWRLQWINFMTFIVRYRYMRASEVLMIHFIQPTIYWTTMIHLEQFSHI